jgi:hypothetical protein
MRNVRLLAGPTDWRRFCNYLSRKYTFSQHEIALYHPQNEVAVRLYTSFGFVKTGEMTVGEEIMRLALKSG